MSAFCLPCMQHGRMRSATRRVASEPWCNECYCDGDEEPESVGVENNKMAAYQLEYRRRNREAIAARMREYYQRNKATIAIRRREYYLRNKAAIAGRMRDYRQRNKVSLAIWMREYRKSKKKKGKSQKTW
jgi:hypothetical protein